jgi:hypothetical protein
MSEQETGEKPYGWYDRLRGIERVHLPKSAREPGTKKNDPANFQYGVHTFAPNRVKNRADRLEAERKRSTENDNEQGQ